ncbi:MAG: RHS repeat-associated core domain-containing protein, partial [bacterium]|nr:RHS repeat-associated core domain-containing protein [bacterium]
TRQHCTDDNIPVITYYQYDGGGQRIRKITENQAAAGTTPTKKEERIYVSGYELYKKHSGTDAGLERVSLSLMDAGHRFVMVETRNGINDGTEKQLVRYQLHNHLGSAALELDGTLDAKVISYEEYHPFGTTAYQAKNQDIKSAAKRYRYTGMERDEETGMEYHSARYYLPWLGRWLSADPIWIEGGENIYRYGRNNPVKMTDLSGNQPAEIFSPETALVAATALQRAAQVWGTAGIFTGGAAVAAPAIVAAPAAGAALPVAAAVTYALAISGAMIGALHIYMGRTGSIARYGNPYGMPSRDIAFPVLRAAREMRADPFPIPPPLPAPAPEGEERRRPRLEGRIYVTYTRYNPETGLTYSGRTSAVIDLNMPWRPQADAAVAARDANHHIDERPEPTASSFLPARLDQFAVGYAVGYGERYRDAAYLAIRGREQQLIDHYGATRAAELGSSATFTGGAWTDSNPGPHLTENNFRGVARDNLLGPVFHAASDLAFRPLASYTGDINP